MTSYSKDNSRVIVFDFDGTLVDSMGNFSKTAAQIMAKFYDCKPNWAKTQYQKTSGLPFVYQLEKIFPNNIHNLKASQAFEKQKMATYLSAPFYNGVLTTIAELKKKGYLTAISSNNNLSLIQERLTGMESLFDLVLGFRPNFLKGKDHFRWIQHCFKVETDQITFVGDSLHDAKMAHENGVQFIAKIGTFKLEDFFQIITPNLWIQNFDELPPLLESLTPKLSYQKVVSRH